MHCCYRGAVDSPCQRGEAGYSGMAYAAAIQDMQTSASVAKGSKYILGYVLAWPTIGQDILYQH
jgi:hypothetical protein